MRIGLGADSREVEDPKDAVRVMPPTQNAVSEYTFNREMNAVSARPAGHGDQGEQRGRSRGEKDVEGCFQDTTFNITNTHIIRDAKIMPTIIAKKILHHRANSLKRSDMKISYLFKEMRLITMLAILKIKKNLAFIFRISYEISVGTN